MKVNVDETLASRRSEEPVPFIFILVLVPFTNSDLLPIKEKIKPALILIYIILANKLFSDQQVCNFSMTFISTGKGG